MVLAGDDVDANALVALCLRHHVPLRLPRCKIVLFSASQRLDIVFFDHRLHQLLHFLRLVAAVTHDGGTIMKSGETV